jgi:predicted metal-dependent peptidase
LQPTVPWHALLARHVVSRAHHDYSFQKPSRREGDAILPRLDSAQLALYVVLDVSGSVSESQLKAFATELEAIKGQVRARITLHACDEQLSADGPWTYEAWEPVILPPTVRGGAGTDFRPVFQWIREAMHRPDLLVYFTDGEGEFPPAAPPYPVIWLVKGPASVPWGERIQLN